MERLKIDDPVGCVPTHCFAGIWGILSVSFFGEVDLLEQQFSSEYGILKGGPWSFLGTQMLVVLTVCAWSATATFLELLLVDKLLGLRMSVEEERMGSDKIEHGIDYWDPCSTNQQDGNTQRVGNMPANPAHVNHTLCTLCATSNSLEDMRKSLPTHRHERKRSFSMMEFRNGVISDGVFVLTGSLTKRAASIDSLAQTNGKAVHVVEKDEN